MKKLLLLVLFVTACKTNPVAVVPVSSPIVGKWIDHGRFNDTLTILTDTTCSIVMPGIAGWTATGKVAYTDGLNVRATWEQVVMDNYAVHNDARGWTDSLKVSLNGDTLYGILRQPEASSQNCTYDSVIYTH